MRTVPSLFEFFKLIGFRESLDIVIIFLISYFLYSNQINTGLLLICILILLTSSFFTHVINDIYDFKTDLINKRDKPLVKGNFTINQAKIIATYFFCCAIFFSLIIKNLVYVDFAFLLLILGLIYSHPLINFSHRAYMSLLVIIFGSVIIPYFLGQYAALGHYKFLDTVSLLSGIIFIVIGRVVLKDIWDVEGDKLSGRKTFAIFIKTNRLLIFSLFMHLLGTLFVFSFMYHYVSKDLLFIYATLAYVSMLTYLLLQQNKIKAINQVYTIRKLLIKIYLATRLYFVLILVFIFLN